MDRTERSEEVYEQLFGPRNPAAPDTDPEFGWILRKLIFGEVFDVGELDARTRELVTCVCLTALQALPQLKAHANAALNVGVTPIELREAIYQCAPFLGFPRTLNAIGVLNEVLRDRGVELPLPDQVTTTDADRFEKGAAIQRPIYGDEIAAGLAGLPEPFGSRVPRFLTEFAFGDFYTRGGLDVPTRELLLLCLLVAMGLTPQIDAHVRGNLRLGTSIETQLAALVHCFPYVGFPVVLNAIRVVQTIAAEGDAVGH